MLPVCTADCCLSHCSIPSLFYLIFVHLFALSRQASYRLPFAIDRLIDMIDPKLLRLTNCLSMLAHNRKPLDLEGDEGHTATPSG
jgi:hypothetical protein